MREHMLVLSFMRGIWYIKNAKIRLKGLLNMPINFMNRKLYEINYDIISNELNSVQIFQNKTIQKIYCSKWLEKLAECDIKSCKDVTEPLKREILSRELQEAPELFQFPIIFGNTTMYVHFWVSRINKVLELYSVSEDNLEKIDISEFANQDGNICWTATRDNVVIKSEPIVLAPIKLRNYTTIVIDGNHRITEAIERHVKYVRAITIDENFLIESHLFPTEFDELLYIFHNEVAVLSSYIEAGVSDEEVLKKSYFYTGKIPYYENEGF